MKKYIFTESQIKKIIEGVLNEQQSKMIPPGGSAQGKIKIINGKYMILVSGEMGGRETIGPFNFNVQVKNDTLVHVANENGKIIVYGIDPKSTVSSNQKNYIRYN